MSSPKKLFEMFRVRERGETRPSQPPGVPPGGDGDSQVGRSVVDSRKNKTKKRKHSETSDDENTAPEMENQRPSTLQEARLITTEQARAALVKLAAGVVPNPSQKNHQDNQKGYPPSTTNLMGCKLAMKPPSTVSLYRNPYI